MRRPRDACSALVALIDDMPLGKVTQDEIFRVGKNLPKLPGNRQKFRPSLGDRADSWRAWIEHAKQHGLPRVTSDEQ